MQNILKMINYFKCEFQNLNYFFNRGNKITLRAFKHWKKHLLNTSDFYFWNFLNQSFIENRAPSHYALFFLANWYYRKFKKHD